MLISINFIHKQRAAAKNGVATKSVWLSWKSGKLALAYLTTEARELHNILPPPHNPALMAAEIMNL